MKISPKKTDLEVCSFSKIKQFLTALTLILLIHTSLYSNSTEQEKIWGARADMSSKALIRNYWNAENSYFNYGERGSKTEFHYWPQAHALDVMLDAFNRTKDTSYLPYIHAWFGGVPIMNGNSFLNRYIDDMEWNALAMLRAYQATGDQKFLDAVNLVWDDIKKYWNEHAGGGLMWEKRDPFGKNACSNGPAAILAARLFKVTRNQDDLNWAKKIYDWQRNTLYDENSGAIWDNIKAKDGELTINKRWIFTYNQGTFIGAAIELFDLSNDSTFLYDAIKATDYTLEKLTVAHDRLLKDEGKHDGGLFKGIFIRYFTQLIKHHALQPGLKAQYTDFLFHNAETLWREGTNKEAIIFGSYWNKKPGDTTDLTVMLSGAMLIEAAANLEDEGFSSGMKTADYPVWSGNPVFNGWYADPEVIIYGDKYWIYPTFSAEYEKQVHFDCFSSPDLVNWTKHENILDTAEVKWARRAMWAPGVIEKDGKYYFFFAANDVQPGQEGGIGVAVANTPEGPYKDLIGKPLISENVNGAQPIDQYVFKDKDGSYYMYYGGWRHCNVVKLNDDFTGLVPLPDGNLFKEVTPQGYVEGPIMFIRNEKYYFMWSEGGWTGPNYKVAYAIADNPFGPFERIGTVLQQDAAVATGAGHHSVVNVPGTDEWYIVYHRRPLSETSPHHRVTCIDVMEFDETGFIKPVRITFEGVNPRPLTIKAK
jgi:predicted alpha-1,6-mannanase (GH76 family)